MEERERNNLRTVSVFLKLNLRGSHFTTFTCQTDALITGRAGPQVIRPGNVVPELEFVSLEVAVRRIETSASSICHEKNV